MPEALRWWSYGRKCDVGLIINPPLAHFRTLSAHVAVRARIDNVSDLLVCCWGVICILSQKTVHNLMQCGPSTSDSRDMCACACVCVRGDYAVCACVLCKSVPMCTYRIKSYRNVFTIRTYKRRFQLRLLKKNNNNKVSNKVCTLSIISIFSIFSISCSA